MFKRIWRWLAKGEEHYDVAFSYASENRDKVDPVAETVEKAGRSVYYDKHKEVEDWGKDVSENLADIYSNRGQFCVIFASKEYAEKKWPKFELGHALKRAAREEREYLLLARIDDTPLEGVSPNMKYVDAVPADALADKIVRKIKRFRLLRLRRIAAAVLAVLAILVPTGIYIREHQRPGIVQLLPGSDENIVRVRVANQSSKSTEPGAFHLMFEKLPINDGELTLVDQAAKTVILPKKGLDLVLTTPRLKTQYNEAASRKFVRADIEKLLGDGQVRLKVDMHDADDPARTFTWFSEPYPAHRIASFILNWIPEDAPIDAH